jgi:hypothetical protein
MQTRTYDGAEARRVLAAIIQDPAVCARVAAQWKPEGLFDVGWANLAAGLAVRYHKQYNRPPNGQFTVLFEDWAATTTADEKTVKNIERFLQTVSDEAQHSPGESDYLLDLAARYFERVVLEREIEVAKDEIARGQVVEARARLKGLPMVNLGTDAYFEPHSDIELWNVEKETRQKPLVYYRGDLGDFIGDVMVRKTLFAFLGADKMGKTTWLIDATYRAVRNRCRVAYFELGDGDQDEFMDRFGRRVCCRPIYSGVYKVPYDWNGNAPEVVEEYIKAYDEVEGFTKYNKLVQNQPRLRVECHSNGTFSVYDIHSTLENWSQAGWRPDVIVADYADIMAPPPGVKDALEQIDETWKALKRLAQDWKCLVLTATQADAAAYALGQNALLSRKNFSGRKTKNAHVNGIIGININPQEKQAGAARINWVVRRKGEQNDLDFCRVAGSFALGNPAMISKRREW